ncbi:MAG: histidine kinase [Calditrichaceae bacterium]|nr:histidine kinase [Calditrichaceae bacterium]MBN2707848.1 histidine kinase [Calditrichaceae bacterium]RQV94914.1 MAG: hypothetical protein EH224_09130 [Calditrichota bacterium]
MHPFLKSLRRFLLAVVVWLFVMAALIFTYHHEAQISLNNAAIFLAPPFFILFFLLNSVWYVCKSTPFSAGKWHVLILRHGASVVFLVLAWFILISVYSELLIQLYPEVAWKKIFQQTIWFFILSATMFYFLIMILNYFLILLERTREIEQQALYNHIAAVQAELKSLKSTIHPHFLFNSFAALDTLIRTDPEKAREVCIQLSDFLRYSIRYGEKEFVTIGDETEHIKNYLEVEKVRFGDRLYYEMDLDPELKKIKILPFVLLPLAENAVKHGVSQMIGRSELKLQISRTRDRILISFINPYDPESPAVVSSGSGLDNLRRRLNAHYGDKTNLHVTRKNGIATAVIELPLEKT